MSKLGLFKCFSKVNILLLWPDSCWFWRICWAYTDWGMLFLMYRMVFEKYVQATASLAYVRQVARVTCQLINSPFIVGRSVVVSSRFDHVGYGIAASECYLDIYVPNTFVTLRICGEMKANITIFYFFYVCVCCGVLCFMFYPVS